MAFDPAEVEQVFKRFDVNNDGQITFDEIASEYGQKRAA